MRMDPYAASKSTQMEENMELISFHSFFLSDSMLSLSPCSASEVLSSDGSHNLTETPDGHVLVRDWTSICSSLR
jgi:hypothetical protein